MRTMLALALLCLATASQAQTFTIESVDRGRNVLVVTTSDGRTVLLPLAQINTRAKLLTAMQALSIQTPVAPIPQLDAVIGHTFDLSGNDVTPP